MLARITHAVEVANWQRGADKSEARSRRNFPDLVLLPGQTDPRKKTFKGKPKPIEWMRQRLGW